MVEYLHLSHIFLPCYNNLVVSGRSKLGRSKRGRTGDGVGETMPCRVQKAKMKAYLRPQYQRV